MAELPSGTVTFLFTDLVGSTRLWEDQPDAMAPAMAAHDKLLDDGIASHGGVVFSRMGDGMAAAFSSAPEAVAAAVEVQFALAVEVWGATGPLRARIGLHTGQGTPVGDQYESHSLNRCARLMAVAHGGQILVSGATAALVGDSLPDGVELVDLGEHRLRDLARPMQVFQVVHDGLERSFPALRSLDSLPGNLPLQLDSFVGRERDVIEIGELLRENRVVTLTGVGGVGKTRLALQVAAEVSPRFRDGVWLVELARLRDPSAVGDAVAAALGMPIRRNVPMAEALVDLLRPKQLLLVLDNCEHLLGPTAELVRTLELACAELVVLATSREGLGISGERLVAVRSLVESECEQLFVDRAVAAKGDFALTDANRPFIVEICRRLDGIPLAIQLAAARVAVLSPAQLAQRLDQRFRILAGGERGAIERHATLRAAIDWSYDLLEPHERLMLSRLSVFAGGCTLEAAEAICAGGPIAEESVLDLVTALVARSLAVADTSSSGDAYYGLLETIRQYAEEHLDADDRVATNDRHARYYAGWISAAVTGLQGPEQADWLVRVERDTENLRAAMRWAVRNADHDLAYALLAPVWHNPLWDLPAGRALFVSADDVLDLVRAAHSEHLADVVGYAALLANDKGDQDRAAALATEALALANNPDSLAVFLAWATRSFLWAMTGDLGSNVESIEQIRAWVRRAGNPYDVAWMLLTSVIMQIGNRDFEGARAATGEALELARGTGAPIILAYALTMRARVLVDVEPDTARNLMHEALAAYESVGYAQAPGTELALMMSVGVRLDDPEVALRAGKRLFDATSSGRLQLVGALEQLATTLAERSPQDAAILHGAIDALAPGLLKFGTTADTRARADQSIEAQLDPETIRRLHDQGAHMSEQETTALARTLIDEALRD